MKKPLLMCVFALFAFCGVVGVSAAFDASDICIYPDENAIVPGTPVVASVTVPLEGSRLWVFITDLDNAFWVATSADQDVTHQHPIVYGQTFPLNGLRHPNSSMQVQVTLVGDAPAGVGEKTMMKIFEKDANGNTVTHTQRLLKKTVVV